MSSDRERAIAATIEAFNSLSPISVDIGRDDDVVSAKFRIDGEIQTIVGRGHSDREAAASIAQQLDERLRDNVDLDGLGRIGCEVLHSKLDRLGHTVHLVKTPGGASVAMRLSDMTELIAGRTTIHDVVQLDRAAHMETPWPTATRPWPRPAS